MTDPVKIYADSAGYNHEVACGAVYGAGYADGFTAGLNTQAAPVVEPTPVVEAAPEIVAETPNPTQGEPT